MCTMCLLAIMFSAQENHTVASAASRITVLLHPDIKVIIVNNAPNRRNEAATKLRQYILFRE